VEYGTNCRDCVFKHEPCGDGGCACEMQNVTCWSCGSEAKKIDATDMKGHPYPHQFYECTKTTCAESKDKLVRCKGCHETTVNWWKKEDDDIWDDLDQCTSCRAVFCPSCNQCCVGCRYAGTKEDVEEYGDDLDERFLYCNTCPLMSPYNARYEAFLTRRGKTTSMVVLSS
jgi:hypothetical protein